MDAPRSADERPRFRDELVAQPIDDGGIRYVEVTDPSSGTTFRFYDVEYSIACAMDGTRTLDDLAAWTLAELGIETSRDELANVVGTLADLGYLATSAPAGAQPGELGFEDAGLLEERTRIEAPPVLPDDETDLGAPGDEPGWPEGEPTVADALAAGPDYQAPPEIPIDETPLRLPEEQPVSPRKRVITREVPKFDMVARMADEAVGGLDPPLDAGSSPRTILPLPPPRSSPPRLPPPSGDETSFENLLDDELVSPSAFAPDAPPSGDGRVSASIRAPQVTIDDDLVPGGEGQDGGGDADGELASMRASLSGALGEALPDADASAPPAEDARDLIRLPPTAPASVRPKEHARASAAGRALHPARSQRSRTGKWVASLAVICVVVAGGAVAVRFVVLPRLTAAKRVRTIVPARAPAEPPIARPVDPQPAEVPASQPTAAPPLPIELPVATLQQSTGAIMEARSTTAGRVLSVVAAGQAVTADETIVSFVGATRWEKEVRATTDRLTFYEHQLETAKATGAEALVTLSEHKVAEKQKIIENAKKNLAAVTVKAPIAGTVRPLVAVGQAVAKGGVVARVTGAEGGIGAVFAAGQRAASYRSGVPCVVAEKSARDRQLACVVDKVDGESVSVRLVPGSAAKGGDEVVLLPPR